MDAPISITLAHLIIIWTLSIFLFAWMLIFAILALRYRIQSKNDTGVTGRQDTTTTANSSRTVYTATASFSSQKQHPETVSRPLAPYNTTMTNNEVPATPIM